MNDKMTVEEASLKLCPIGDTSLYTSDPTMNYCVTSGCMAWVYTNEHSKESCRGNVKLPEKEKEGYCALINKENK